MKIGIISIFLLCGIEFFINGCSQKDATITKEQAYEICVKELRTHKKDPDEWIIEIDNNPITLDSAKGLYRPNDPSWDKGYWGLIKSFRDKIFWIGKCRTKTMGLDGGVCIYIDSQTGKVLCIDWVC